MTQLVSQPLAVALKRDERAGSHDGRKSPFAHGGSVSGRRIALLSSTSVMALSVALGVAARLESDSQ